MLEEGLYTRLSGVAGLTALVSTRIFPQVMPEGTALPALVYARVSGVRVQNLANSSGVAHPRMQIDVIASSYSSAKAVAEQVRLALQDNSGTWGSTVVQHAIFLGDTDFFDDADGVHRVSLDFEIWHDESRAVS